MLTTPGDRHLPFDQSELKCGTRAAVFNDLKEIKPSALVAECREEAFPDAGSETSSRALLLATAGKGDNSVDIPIEPSGTDSPGPSSPFTVAVYPRSTTAPGAIWGEYLARALSSFSEPVDSKSLQMMLDEEFQKLKKGQARTTSAPFVELIKIRSRHCLSVAKIDWPGCVQMLTETGIVLIGTDSRLNDALYECGMPVLANLVFRPFLMVLQKHFCAVWKKLVETDWCAAAQG